MCDTFSSALKTAVRMIVAECVQKDYETGLPTTSLLPSKRYGPDSIWHSIFDKSQGKEPEIVDLWRVYRYLESYYLEAWPLTTGAAARAGATKEGMRACVNVNIEKRIKRMVESECSSDVEAITLLQELSTAPAFDRFVESLDCSCSSASPSTITWANNASSLEFSCKVT